MVLREILKLHKMGHAIVVITHEVDRILAHATRLVIMSEGTIVRDGDPASLVSDLENYDIRGLKNAAVDFESMTWLDKPGAPG